MRVIDVDATRRLALSGRPCSAAYRVTQLGRPCTLRLARSDGGISEPFPAPTGAGLIYGEHSRRVWLEQDLSQYELAREASGFAQTDAVELDWWEVIDVAARGSTTRALYLISSLDDDQYTLRFQAQGRIREVAAPRGSAVLYNPKNGDAWWQQRLEVLGQFVPLNGLHTTSGNA